MQTIIVGRADGILIPELDRARSGLTRLRGLRLLHTHLSPEGLSEEDLMDMLFLRLDAVISLTVSPQGMPVQWQSAQLLPPSSNQPYRLDRPRPWDQPQGDITASALALEEELARGSDAGRDASDVNRCVLVSISPEPRHVQEHHLDELAELARTAGITVCGRLVQRVRGSRVTIGKGKMAELEVLALMGRADMLVFDGELAPVQLHNLADITERKVLDRTQLILDIFAQHAVTRAGKLQVELAQLKYMLPRLTGKNRAMDRLMGGIGGRGPGETKLEIDRRRSRERMGRLRRELDALRRQRSYVRGNRERSGIPLAALVGYTNAGKSTLLNTLTRSSVLAQNKLFATLDTTTRRLRFPREREIVLADTVGFIRNLPRELMEAFQATLEELDCADLLIHVADASHPDLPQQIASVNAILDELDLASVPTLLVLNKWDALTPEQQARTADAVPGALHVSGKTGYGLRRLLDVMQLRLAPGGLDVSDMPDVDEDWELWEDDGPVERTLSAPEARAASSGVTVTSTHWTPDCGVAIREDSASADTDWFVPDGGQSDGQDESFDDEAGGAQDDERDDGRDMDDADPGPAFSR